MRQVFSSVRLENVEQVANLLETAGIETRITHGRSYKGAIHGNFNYREEPGQRQPGVWIVKSEDQVRAREILREAGLMDSSRNAPGSSLSMGLRGINPDPRPDARRRRAFQIKSGLLLAIVVIMALGWVTYRAVHVTDADKVSTGAISEVTTAGNSVPSDLIGPGTTSTPDSLAVALLRGELPAHADDVVCLAIDGRDASPALLAALPPAPGRALPLSQCPIAAVSGAMPQVLAIGKYVADATGAGTIFLQRRRIGRPPAPQWYRVRREGEGWRIIQPL